MASGTHKNGVKIDLVYQAAALLAAAVPVGTVYDETATIHSAQTTSLTSSLIISANMLSGVGAGRYLGYFTPDAEGRWTVIIQDKNGDGEVSKVYEVCGHDIDSIGDLATAAPALISDVESAVNVAISEIALISIPASIS